jgi:hypothetical protein
MTQAQQGIGFTISLSPNQFASRRRGWQPGHFGRAQGILFVDALGESLLGVLLEHLSGGPLGDPPRGLLQIPLREGCAQRPPLVAQTNERGWACWVGRGDAPAGAPRYHRENLREIRTTNLGESPRGDPGGILWGTPRETLQGDPPWDTLGNLEGDPPSDPPGDPPRNTPSDPQGSPRIPRGNPPRIPPGDP